MKRLVVLYPADYFDVSVCDEDFLAESQAVSLKLPVRVIHEIKPFSPKLGEVYVYRGWMLSPQEYERLFQRTNEQLLISPYEYKNNHYITGWLDEVADFTAQTWLTKKTDIEDIVDFYNTMPGKYFIKDYVKSLKTAPGPIVEDEDSLRKTLRAMQHFRGKIEGGIAFKEVLNIEPGSEFRVFYAGGKIFGDVPADMKMFVQEVAFRMDDKKFISMDFAQIENKEPVLIEIGDGQVSDFLADDKTKGLDLVLFTQALCALE